jgi:phosphoribosylanthranilate isomerase
VSPVRMGGAVWVKICGITSVRDGEMIASAGADAIGLNFVPSSPRAIDRALAKEIAREVAGRVELVGVFADRSAAEMLEIREEVGLDWIQLHGDEAPETVLACGPRAMKALRVSDVTDVARAHAYGGGRLLVDAKVSGALGGTGHAFDWSLVQGLAGQRQLVLAGGLRPDNVELAISRVRPFGVDTASGVESAPGQKSRDKVRTFIELARAAARALQAPV